MTVISSLVLNLVSAKLAVTALADASASGNTLLKKGEF